MISHNCARCGHAGEAGAGFCGRCGQPFGAGVRVAGPTSAAPAGGYAAGLGPAAAAALGFGVRPFRTVGDVLGPTFQLYREHFVPVGKIVLAATLPQVAVQYAVMQMAAAGWAGGAFVGMAAYWLLTVVVSSLMTGALIYGVAVLLGTGASPPLAESYGWALRAWWKIFLCWLMAGLLTGLGTLLLVVPGIILMVALSVALPALAVEGRGPVAALERSIELTRGYRWLILFTMLLLWAVTAAVAYLTTGFDDHRFATGTSFLVALATAALQQMLASTFTVLSLFTYFGIRADRGAAAGGRAAP